MLTRGERKRLIRKATRMRIAAERDALAKSRAAGMPYKSRMEEIDALVFFGKNLHNVPSVQDFAADLGLEAW